MIKLFRKIRYDLMNQNKTAKYFKYAIGEIVLVVIGILFALQINNWNEQRKQNTKEQQILLNLESDFKENLIEYNRVNELCKTSYEGNIVLLNLIKSDKPITNPSEVDKLIDLIINDFATLDLISGSVDEIINTGSLSIIKDDRLRKQLSNWSQEIVDCNDDVKIFLDHLFAILIPSIKDQLLLRNIDIPEDIVQNLNLSQISKSNFNLDYNTTIKTIEFENKIYVNALNLAYTLNAYKDLESYLNETLNLIRANLK